MAQPERHSTIVGGSTAKQVINCPGSVALCQTMPQGVSSSYADEGTLLHKVISQVLETGKEPEHFLGWKDESTGLELTEALLEEKLLPALQSLDEVDPEQKMEYAVETEVFFGKTIPDAFGSCDLLGRLDGRAIVLDWKFGSGVAVEVEENEQLFFYAAAAMRTKEMQWVFEGVKEIELIIIQPPALKRWVTNVARVKKFEKDLKAAVDIAKYWVALAKAQGLEYCLTCKPYPLPLQQGSHCGWCKAKSLCPKMTGAVERAVSTDLEGVDPAKLCVVLHQIPLLKKWIEEAERIALYTLENGKKIPGVDHKGKHYDGWKLVTGREGNRKWSDEAAVLDFLGDADVFKTKPELLSVAQMEKVFKKRKLDFEALQEYVTRSEGKLTLAAESDPRPEALQIGQAVKRLADKLY